MRLQQVGLAAVLAILVAGGLAPLIRAQVKPTTSSDGWAVIEGTGPADDPRYGYLRPALKQIERRHPQLQIPADIVRIVVDNKRLAKALGFPAEAARQMDEGFMYTLTDHGQFARPTFLNVKSKVWEALIANQRQDGDIEPMVCVLAASLEHEVVGHMIRNDHDELAPTALEIVALRECARGGLADHPSVVGRLNWLDRRIQMLRSSALGVAAAR